MTNNNSENKSALIQDSASEYEYTLKGYSCWITVESLSVYVVRNLDGVEVSIYEAGRETVYKAGREIEGCLDRIFCSFPNHKKTSKHS